MHRLYSYLGQQTQTLYLLHWQATVLRLVCTFVVCCKKSGFLATRPSLKHTFEPVHGISNNVVCLTSKASDQPAPLLVARVYYDC